MKRKNLLVWSLVAAAFVGVPKVVAEDVDLTDLIINNDFDYIAEDTPVGKDDVGGGGWKPTDTTPTSKTYNQGITEFYGWECDLSVLTFGSGQSFGINQDAKGKGGNGIYSAWIKADKGKFPVLYEFCQTIGKDKLEAGTYMVQCRLSDQNSPTSQRLFANQNVQYCRLAENYKENQTAGEVATFAGYASMSQNNLKEMKVYTTIGDNDSLKIGIRTSNIKGDGTEAGNGNGWFRVDYFQLTKIDPVKASDATLANLYLDFGDLNFDPETYEYEVAVPKGVDIIYPVALPSVADVTVTGAEEVALVDGVAESKIVVTALDGKTTKTYTLKYKTSGNDENLTHLIINNDFSLIAEGVAMSGETWKPGTDTEHPVFYGWECDFSLLDGTSQGINTDLDPVHDTYGAWVGSGKVFPEFFEFSQTIAKENLDAGTYLVQAWVGGTKLVTSQRLFANQNVQYCHEEKDYANNQTDGEIATFAGIPFATNDNWFNLWTRNLKVYTTIADDEDLKIGIRTGGKKANGELGGNNDGMFKVDYFRLVKIDPAKAANADLADITLSVGEIDFKAETITYDVTLPKGTQSVKPTVVAEVNDVIVKGAEEVTLEEDGTGISTIVVTALDGTTQKTYTINYTADGPTTGLEQATVKANCFVNNGVLTVTGVNAYSVYALNGLKVAEVQNNTSATTVALQQGIYLVKSANAGVVKVVVK